MLKTEIQPEFGADCYLFQTRMPGLFQMENSFLPVDNLWLGVRNGSTDGCHCKTDKTVQLGAKVTQLGDERNVTEAEKEQLQLESE